LEAQAELKVRVVLVHRFLGQLSTKPEALASKL